VSTNTCATADTLATLGITKKERKVKLVEKSPSNFPELWCSIYIVGSEQAQFPQLFSRAKCWKAKDIASADIVVFTGGCADVSPELYGEEKHKTVMSDKEEDMRDILVFREAVALGVPMIGVCRGAQFGHVMNGGKLFQHVDNHNKAHNIFVRRGGYYIQDVSSVHHQMCRPNEQGGMEIIAETYQSTGKWINDKICFPSNTDFDIEAFWYPETAFLGVQGHPEYPGFEEYTQFFMELIEEYITTNPQLRILKGLNRVPQDTIDNRKWREPALIDKFVKGFS
jgi:gamma-glutamyl-gamma-aminobutyrate hydrolase PuuD